MTEIDFDNVEARAVRTSAENQILAEWNEINRDLEARRDERQRVNEDIRHLVEKRKVKARLVRVIAPELLKSNGDE